MTNETSSFAVTSMSADGPHKPIRLTFEPVSQAFKHRFNNTTELFLSFSSLLKNPIKLPPFK